VPAYYFEWFINRLRDGYVYVRNPFNQKSVSEISLHPDLVDCIVFWTKDVRPAIDKLSIIEEMGYRNYFFQYTITPYDHVIEPGIRNKEDMVKALIELSERIGKDRVIWRYDPIFVSKMYNAEFHVRSFEKYCSKISRYSSCVIISFVDVYAHIQKRYISCCEDDVACIARKIKNICSQYNLTVQTCCENISKHGISQGSCLERKKIFELCNKNFKLSRDSNQRKNCLCAESIDVGAYNTCLTKCSYCYANKYKSISTQYDPYAPLLCSKLTPEDVLYKRRLNLLQNSSEQTSIVDY